MSYCATCGRFYRPDCTNHGLCRPGANPFEERIAALTACSVAVAAAVCGMMTENIHAEANGNAPPYRKQAFDALAKELLADLKRATP